MEEEFNNVFIVGNCLCTLNCPRQVSHFTLARGGSNCARIFRGPWNLGFRATGVASSALPKYQG